MLTEPRPADLEGPRRPETRSVAVVMPMVADPDWSLFEGLSEDVPMIVVDDSGGKLSPAPRGNVRFFGYEAQEKVMGRHYAAIPHRSSASRNFGHYLAYKEGFDVIVALDYDCRPREGWLRGHLSRLGPVAGAPAVQAEWVNTIAADGFFARGFPYERRHAHNEEAPALAAGEVKLNMGVWDNILDINGIDKIQCEPPAQPGLRPGGSHVALGNLPICGMNTAFAAELTPAYFFMPDVWVGGRWQLSRHDDIWGGYVLKRLMDRRGDLVAFGEPVVEHTRQSNLHKVIVVEHYMHLMSEPFYALVDEAAAALEPGPYDVMFAAFCAEYLRRVDSRPVPAHYRAAFRELGEQMKLWADCFA